MGNLGQRGQTSLMDFLNLSFVWSIEGAEEAAHGRTVLRIFTSQVAMHDAAAAW